MGCEGTLGWRGHVSTTGGYAAVVHSAGICRALFPGLHAELV